MNEAKHTKGPWELGMSCGIGPSVGLLVQTRDTMGSRIAAVHCDDEEVGIANARLIAAAPEQNQALLDAPEMDCWADMTREELERVVEGYTKWFHGQRAEALRKAEGK